MVVGGILGFAAGKLLLFLIARLKLAFDGLYPVLAIGIVFLTYGIANLTGGSGFLSVYMIGLVLGQAELQQKRSLLRFFDGMAWLVQIAMFLTLGLLVFPSRLVPIFAPGLILAVVLILIARPVSVWLSLSLSKFSMPEKAFLSWVGLRGAVPIILATYPKLAGLQESDLIFNVVFFVVLTSALIQGTSMTWLARRLSLEPPPENDGPTI
jgi:potassium/hydrogen antiporter